MSKATNAICPKCRDERVSLYLDDLETFQCRSCEEEFSADELRDLVACWTPILDWIDKAPPKKEKKV